MNRPPHVHLNGTSSSLSAVPLTTNHPPPPLVPYRSRSNGTCRRAVLTGITTVALLATYYSWNGRMLSTLRTATIATNDKSSSSSSSSSSLSSTTRRDNNSSSNSNTNSKGTSSYAPSSSSSSSSTSSSSSSSLSSPQFILTEEEEFMPKIVWLMSWPNSGTSFTMSAVEKYSNRSAATNYGDEVLSANATSLPIYPFRLEGPFWKGLRCDAKLGKARDLPTHFVLTKTHCGSRCVRCRPQEYLETPQSFLTACASGSGRFPPRRKRHLVHYPPNRVHKAIHLLRNPFHNVIARFHLDRRNHLKPPNDKKYKVWVSQHPNNETGFARWCRETDTAFVADEEKSFSKDLLALLKPVPCRSEFYKYVQWHNMVQESLTLLQSQTERDVPILTIYYEDYERQLHQRLDSILEFLQLTSSFSSSSSSALPTFEAHDDTYQTYFTKEERQHVQRLMKFVATPETWQQIQRYF